MLINKKLFLLLLSVPMYVCYLYVCALFEYASFFWNDVVCFSVFVATTTMLMVTKEERIKVPCFLFLHMMLFAFGLFESNLFNIAKRQLLIYCLFFLPVLLLISILATAEPAPSKRNSHKKKKNRDIIAGLQIIFGVYLIVMAVILAVCLIEGKEIIHFVFDAAGICFLLLLLFFAFCLWNVSRTKTKAPEKKIVVSYISMLCVMAAFDGLIYIFCMNQYVNDKVQLLFPAFLSAVLFFDRYPMARKAVFNAES